LAAALGAAAMTASLLLSAGTAAAETPDKDASHFVFTKVADPADVTFTQLLGINDHQLIAGYHTNTPGNKGFTLKLPDKFTDENFPNSAQTQVVGVNNDNDTVGFYIDQAGTTHGFLKESGKDAVTVDLPGTTFNQLLGINNHDEAAGYFQDNASPAPLQHAYIHEPNGDFRVLGNLPLPSSQATGINDKGTIVGFLQQSTADTNSTGFILKGGKLTELKIDGSTFTQALGVNNDDDVVGTFNDANGVAHGFLYHDGHSEQIDVPGASSTVINGINKDDQIVGFFVDANTGNTVGAVGEPKRS
jgi:probable HAF family extracellular repeat protein